MQIPLLKLSVFSFLLLPLYLLLLDSQPTNKIELTFYSDKVTLNYDPAMKVSFNQMLEEQAIVRFYEVLSDTDYDLLVDDLKQYRLKLGLNDWLFYQLIQQSLAKINPHQSRREKVLTTWFLLSKLDYDTRLAFLKKEAFIYVRSMDEVFETPLIEEEGHTFVGLTEMQYQRTSTNKGVYLLNFLGAPNGQPFSFALQALPNLKKNLELKKLRFDWLGESHEVSVRCDKTIVDMMKKYPVIAESDYIKAPFSNTLKASLVPQIQQIVEGKSIVETLKILTTFTRSAFRYKEDEDYFGRSKPMIREEVFFYPYSDCEDRSALFYGLVEEILGLPMIIVAFPDHLTVAVALDQPIGPSIRYKGKKFYICDPTGPSNSIEIGRVPKGYEKQSFEILMDNL